MSQLQVGRMLLLAGFVRQLSKIVLILIPYSTRLIKMDRVEGGHLLNKAVYVMVISIAGRMLERNVRSC
jgi:hypothetical protein